MPSLGLLFKVGKNGEVLKTRKQNHLKLSLACCLKEIIDFKTT